ncbi:unnamed protein product, partial [Closterium sp. Naga37s-1]
NPQRRVQVGSRMHSAARVQPGLPARAHSGRRSRRSQGGGVVKRKAAVWRRTIACVATITMASYLVGGLLGRPGAAKAMARTDAAPADAAAAGSSGGAGSSEGGQWYFSREHIEKHSPSRADGIDLRRETYLRRSYCTFLQDLGMRLRVYAPPSRPSPAPTPFPRPSRPSPAPQPLHLPVLLAFGQMVCQPQITIATAIVFCHRFFMRQSHAKNDRYAIATVCMFLAGKVEETPRALREVVQKSLDAQARKDPAAAAKLPHKEEQQKELILVGEGLVLATLGFDLNVAHAYKPLVAAIKRFKVAQQALAQVAWNFINDGLRTSLCLQVRAEQFAAGAISLAAKFLRVKLPGDSHSPWWADFNVSPTLLHDVSVQLLELYEQVRLAPNPTHAASPAIAIAPSAAAAARATSRGATSSLSSHPPLASATTSNSAPSQGRPSAGGFRDSRGAPGGGGAVGAQGVRRHSDGERERDVERGGQRESDRRREREAVKGRDGRAGGSVGGEGGASGDGGRRAGEAGTVEERGGRQSGGESEYGGQGGESQRRGRDGAVHEREGGEGRRGSEGSKEGVEEEDGEIGEWSGGQVEEHGSPPQGGLAKGGRGSAVDEGEGAEGRRKRRWGGEEEMEYEAMLADVDVGARGTGGVRERERERGRNETQQQWGGVKDGSGERQQQVRARVASVEGGAGRDGAGGAGEREEGEEGEAGEIGEAGEVGVEERGRGDAEDGGRAEGRGRRGGMEVNGHGGAERSAMDLNRGAEEAAAVRSGGSRGGASSRGLSGGGAGGSSAAGRADAGRADHKASHDGEEHRAVQRGALRRVRDADEAGDGDGDGDGEGGSGRHRSGGKWGRHKKARMDP